MAEAVPRLAWLVCKIPCSISYAYFSVVAGFQFAYLYVTYIPGVVCTRIRRIEAFYNLYFAAY